jgi:hypothetical protein
VRAEGRRDAGRTALRLGTEDQPTGFSQSHQDGEDDRRAHDLEVAAREIRTGGVRRTGSGPRPAAASGFTRSLRGEGQIELVLLPRGPCENARLLTPSFVRLHRVAPPTMPSADSPNAITGIAARSVPDAGHDRDLPG